MGGGKSSSAAIMKYFAYGSNMDVRQLSHRIGGKVQQLERKRAVLAGYTLKFNKRTESNPREGKANIVADSDGKTEGVLDTITEDELDKLAEYEGGYERKRLIIGLEDGTATEAATFMAKSGRTRDGLKPTRDYLRHLLAGREFLSREYVQWLESVETLD